jgi:hypothetical protein
MTVPGAFTVITAMVLVGVLPIWPWPRGRACRLAGMAAAILLVLLVLLFASRI